MIALIAAMTKDLVIGKQGALPWRIPEEMKVFRKYTLGNTVVMGRKTYDSIGKPLAERNNIVVSRGMQPLDGVTVCSSVAEALEKAAELGKDIYIIGGASIYTETLPLADKLIISWVKEDYEGDTRFPPFNEKEWDVAERADHEKFETVVYTRKQHGPDRN